MWKRWSLKKKSRAVLKRSYARTTAVCFLIATFTAAYPLSSTFFNLQISPSDGYSDDIFSLALPNSEVIEKTVSYFFPDTPLPLLFKGSISYVSSFAVDFFSSNLSVFFTVLRTLNTFFAEQLHTAALVPALGVLFLFFYRIFFGNLLLIGEKRYFLENRNYTQTPLSKIFFLYKLRYILNPVRVMFCRSFFQFFWNLTVIGGIIKHYEYLMIPFILAENPKASVKDAFFLSRQLMRHNKGKMFLLDCSFIGWRILSFFTLGILDFLFINPYVTGCQTELYASLRRNYVLSRSQRHEVLNDSYLEHVPSEDELLISKALYDDSQGPYTKISYFAPDQYPVFLFSVQPPLKAVRNPLKTDRKYDVYSCIFLFFTFSISGWMLETFLHFIKTGAFEKNVFLHGPWLLLYGIYGLLILFFLKQFLQRPSIVFGGCLILCSVLEYAHSLISEVFFGTVLRDYSNYLLNLNGRIYLGSSVLHALFGCAFLYYLAPKWIESFMKFGRPRRILTCVLFIILLFTDIIFSTMFRVAF